MTPKSGVRGGCRGALLGECDPGLNHEVRGEEVED